MQVSHIDQGLDAMTNLGYRACKINAVGDRPMCSQCSQSGHIAPSSDKSSPASTITKQVHVLPLKGLEQDGFTWFLERTAFKLPGIFYTPAFVELMFQASTLEPAVRHAIVSLASAHQEEVHGTGLEDQRSSFTVQQYGLAIAKLKPCLSTRSISSARSVRLMSSPSPGGSISKRILV